MKASSDSKIITHSKPKSIPKVWKQAAGLLITRAKKNKSDLAKNKNDWDKRLKKLSSL